MMESKRTAAQADTQILDDLMSRLTGQQIVSGILLMGMNGTAALTPMCDSDLLVVFWALSVHSVTIYRVPWRGE